MPEEDDVAELEDELIDVHLRLTRHEAEMLSHATCENYHHMKSVRSDETYGALIQDRTVLASRSLWRKVEAIVRVNEW